MESSFKDMIVETKVTTRVRSKKVVEVVRLAHRRCPMHATVSKAMKVVDKLYVNGQEVPIA